MMRIYYCLALVFVIISSCGCSKDFKLASRVDAPAAKAMMTGGSNKISGSALLRKVNGEVVTCAGINVGVLPVLPITKEWVNIVYTDGKPNGIDYEEGYRQFYGASKLNISGDDIISDLEKTTKCDPQGKFTFTGLQDGDFYVVTQVTWTVYDRYGGPELQGGSLFKKVRLKGGEITDVVLSN